VTLSVKDYLFGPPSSLTVGGVEIGPSEDPATFTVTETQWSLALQGAVSDFAGTTGITKIKAELKTKLNNLSLAMLQVALNKITPTVGTAVTTSPSGLATTLTADAAAGATALVLTSATNIATGSYLHLTDTVAGPEIVKVGTYVSGLTVNLTTPLIRQHQTGEAVVMVNDAGTTILRQRIGRISASAHKDVIMQSVGPDGEPTVVTLFDCLNTAGVSMAFGEATSAGTPVTFTAYADITDFTLAPYAIERLAA
jgi:hypothetical protein